MSKATITYFLNEEGRKKSLLVGGDGKQTQIIEAEINPELLELAFVDSDGNAKLQVGHPTGGYASNATEMFIYSGCGRPELKYKNDAILFSSLQTVETLISFEAARRAKVETQKVELQPELDRLISEYDIELAKKQARREVEENDRKTARQKHEEEERVARELKENEKADWIAAHGSDCLQRSVKLDYSCQRKYIEERATLELSEFAVDFDDNAKWNSRSCPSEEALAVVEKLIEDGREAQVVWLTRPEYKTEYDDDFQPCEAIVISNYLGKYDLVKII